MHKRIVSRKLQRSAKGQQCTMNVAGVCNYNDETTVLAHVNVEGSLMSKLENDYHYLIMAEGIEPPEKEYRFFEGRRWRFDFAWIEKRVAVEIEGVTMYGRNRDGSYKLGRHQTARGFAQDCEKYNRAALEGWTVLRFTQDAILNGRAVLETMQALETVGAKK